MAAAPEISVVMATFAKDHFPHLRVSLESIQAQSFTDFECLLVLDGPIPDSTHTWLRDFVAADPRFRLIPLPENQGAARARNVGIAQAQGRYMAICDADDRNAPERLARQRRCLQAGKLDLVGSWYRVIDDAGDLVATRQAPVTHEAICRAACYFNPIGNSTVFTYTAILQKHPFPTDYQSRDLGEDFDLWIQLLKAGYRLGNIPEYLVDFRMDKAFLRRRSGWGVFRRDLRNKWAAGGLYPRWLRPWAYFVGSLTAGTRLLPNFLLAGLYALRYRLRFRK